MIGEKNQPIHPSVPSRSANPRNSSHIEPRNSGFRNRSPFCDSWQLDSAPSGRPLSEVPQFLKALFAPQPSNPSLIFTTSSWLRYDFLRSFSICSGRKEKGVSVAIQKILVPATGLPVEPGTEQANRPLNLSVVFTSVEATLAALQEAGNLASSLGARITLLVPQVVPYPLPLETPPVMTEFNERRFRVIASHSLVETNVHIYLCRDKIKMLTSVLKPRSIVVLGGRRRWWWPTADEVLAGQLRRIGHEVIFRQTE